MTEYFWWRRRKRRLDLDDMVMMKRYVFVWHRGRMTFVAWTRLGISVLIYDGSFFDDPAITVRVSFDEYPEYAAIFNERGWDLGLLARLLNHFLPPGGTELPPPGD